MTRAYDLDGVICAFCSAYRELIVSECGLEIPPISETFPTIWRWDKAAGVTNRQNNALWKIIKEGDFWETLEPTSEGLAALARIREQRTQGDHVYFITSRPGKYAKHLSEFWLDAHGYECPTVLISSAKGPVCQGLEVEMFLDDKPENCLEVSLACPQAQIFLLDAPYNRNTGIEESRPNVTRVKSILDERIMGVQTVAA